jgi:hypothetical protein
MGQLKYAKRFFVIAYALHLFFTLASSLRPVI